MSVFQHPDGYLQITEGHNWQDISEGSILQRIFRGWNERRLVVGLPLYWYGKNPNASELLGGDAQFVEVENPIIANNAEYNQDKAGWMQEIRIYPNANLQNVGFWNFLLDGLTRLANPFSQNITFLTGWTSYETQGVYSGEEFIEITNPNVITENKPDQLAAGDYITASLINDMLRVLHNMQFLLLTPSGGGVPFVDYYLQRERLIPLAQHEYVPLAGARLESCPTADAETESEWLNPEIPKQTLKISWFYSVIGYLQVFTSTPTPLYDFYEDGFYPIESITHYSYPMDGEMVLVAHMVDRGIGLTPDATVKSPSPFIPSTGNWTITRQSLLQETVIEPTILGFDPSQRPTKNFGINCAQPGSHYTNIEINRLIKPKFSDLAEATDPQFYKYDMNITEIQPEAPITE